MSHRKKPLCGPLRLVLLFCSILASTAQTAHATEGPLQVRNQFPLFLTGMPPYLEPAEPRNELFAGISHSSVSIVEDEQPWSVKLDMELTEFDLRIKKRSGNSTEFGVEIPVLRPSGGFFDGALDQWHDALNVGDYGRGLRPFNAFLYEITLNNSLLVRGVNDRSGFGDVRLTAKQVIRSEAPLVSILAGVELPTGDARTGYGNGSYDAGVAVLADLHFSDRYLGTANLGITIPGDFRGWQTVALQPFIHAGFSLEAAWWSRISVIIQTLVQTSPLPDTRISQLDRPGMMLTIGGRYYGTRGNIEFSLTEDPSLSGVPDFIATVGYVLGF